MRMTTREIIMTMDNFNRVLKDAGSPVKILVFHFLAGKSDRYNVAIADWNNHEHSSLNHMTSEEALAYMSGLVHMATKMGVAK